MAKKGISDLLQVVSDLSEILEYVYWLNESEDFRKDYGLQVKGRGDSPVLFPTLKKCHAIIDEIDDEVDLFDPIHDEFNDLIEFLDENYSVKSKWLKKPEFLREEDFRKIIDSLDNLVRTLIGYSDDLKLASSKKKNSEKFSSKLVKNMDKKTKDDFKEAVKALELGLTTASYMLFCRVAESIARSYYEKFINHSSKNKNWDLMYTEIKNKQHEEKNVQWTILDLFVFLKGRRNEALHPGKRFNKDDCVKIFHNLDEFHKIALKN